MKRLLPIATSMMLTTALFAQAPATIPSLPPRPVAALAVDMDPTQPATAPIILFATITNISDHDLHDMFQQNTGFEAHLTGPDGKTRHVTVTNGSRTRGSFTQPSLKPGDSCRTPLRLTNDTEQEHRDYLPSEQVFLPPGKYTLQLTRHIDGSPPNSAETKTQFTVADNPALAQARWDALKHPAKDQEDFATHVLQATLTPDLRKIWYAEILGDPTPQSAFKLYALTIIHDPPADIPPAIIASFRYQLDHYDPDNREQSAMLNNAANFLNYHPPPNAGDAFLKCALSKNSPNADAWTQDALNGARTASFDALRHYWQPAMANQILPALASNEKWIPIYAARLLAWAGDPRGADTLIAAAQNKNAFAAAGLAYLPNHPAAAQALQTALASPDPAFLKDLHQALAQQPPPDITPRQP